eukprot:XP_001707369.1 Hypothetical protein GL50803_120906 [Giardia lamblia ATCC 50803]
MCPEQKTIRSYTSNHMRPQPTLLLYAALRTASTALCTPYYASACLPHAYPEV